MGSAKTNKAGKFKVTHKKPHGAGKFLATALKKRFVNNAGLTIICKPAVSKKINTS